MPRQPQPEQPADSLRNKVLIERLTLVCAMTVLIPLRKNLGYRQLSPVTLLFTSLFLMWLAWVCQEKIPRSQDLAYFAVAFFVLGVRQRIKRWREFRAGICQHSGYIGSAFTDRFRLPKFLRSERRSARYLDVFFVWIVGAILTCFTPLLGYWIIFAGCCLNALEHSLYQQDLARRFDMVDNLVVSGNQGETIERFSDSPSAQTGKNTSSIPTGLGNDISSKVNPKRPKDNPSARPSSSRKTNHNQDDSPAEEGQ